MRQEKVRRLIAIGSLILMSLIFSITNKYFFTLNNLQQILRESSITGIIAVGVAFVIITAGIDLSTGAILGVTSMFCANLIYYHQIPASLIMLFAILFGTLCGAINGFIVTRLRVPEFVATLSTQYLFRSLVFVFAIRSSGVITNKLIKDPNILIMGGSINGLYLVTIAFFVFVVLGQIVLKKTKFGTYIYATGANRKSAEFSGINTKNIRFAVFCISGFLCGVASIFEMGRVQSVTTDLGTGLEFDIISAVVIGGCAFSGGRGDVVGAMIGTLFMAVLENGIYKYNLPTAVQLIIKGTVIVIMVIFDEVYNQFVQKRIEQKNKIDEVASEVKETI
jgi:ribose transport system permease protein